MTMKIVVKNEDMQRVAKITEETFAAQIMEPTRKEYYILKPGVQQEFYIHAAKRLTITEEP